MFVAPYDVPPMPRKRPCTGMTGAQFRAARLALSQSIAGLARLASIDVAHIRKIEATKGKVRFTSVADAVLGTIWHLEDLCAANAEMRPAA
jgi:hypothetical protein